MALEWLVLACATGFEAVMLVMLTLPATETVRKGLTLLSRGALRPLMTVVPLSLFLLMDMYWKHDLAPSSAASSSVCPGPLCNSGATADHSSSSSNNRSVEKAQRNALLVVTSLLLYWLMCRVTYLLVRIQTLDDQLRKLARRND